MPAARSKTRQPAVRKAVPRKGTSGTAARRPAAPALTSLKVAIDADGIATVTLDRPEVHNAFDDVMVAELTGVLRELDAEPDVRVVILAGNGPSFSAGANLNWMRRTADYSAADNERDALALATLMNTLYRLSKPTIARVHGPAYAGGLGLVACCDIAVATREAKFCLSEVRLGLVPAVVTPYVMAAIGERQTRRYVLTAETFDAAEAYRIGVRAAARHRRGTRAHPHAQRPGHAAVPCRAAGARPQQGLDRKGGGEPDRFHAGRAVGGADRRAARERRGPGRDRGLPREA